VPAERKEALEKLGNGLILAGRN